MQLFFQKLGEGPALIILHGLYGSSDNWVSIARKLSQRYTVYLADQRNHGRSPHSPEHSYKALAEDLKELLDSQKIEQAAIMGHSMGGKAAILFAALYPQYVSRLIVVDIGPEGYARTDKHTPQILAHLNIVQTMLGINFKEFTSRVEIDRELAKTIEDDNVRQFLMKNVHRNPDNSFSWKINIDAISKWMPEIMGSIHLEKLLKNNTLTSFPTLFIKGDKSDYINSDQKARIAQFFPGATIETVLNSGHWVHAEQPGQFYNLVESFLSN